MTSRRFILAGLVVLSGTATQALQAAPAIEAVVLVQGYGSGYNGMITVEYRPAVLYADGTYTKDAARALAAAPPVAGRWKRRGTGFVLQPAGGKPIEVPAPMPATWSPAADARLSRATGSTATR